MAKNFTNYYELLGVSSSATTDELRRAYRILARRYHPDVNPGRASEDTFKQIAQAYDVLSDSRKRAQFDAEFQIKQREGVSAKVRQYQKNARAQTARQRFQEAAAKMQTNTARTASTTEPRPEKEDADSSRQGALLSKLSKLGQSLFTTKKGAAKVTKKSLAKVSILEISISIRDAILGVRKNVEINEPEGRRKISVTLPPAVRTGSVVRMRDKRNSAEELVLIIRVASHPLLSIEPRGLVMEIPITVSEALLGGSITLPTLEDQVVVSIPPGAKSGSEIRVKEKGIMVREGGRGDLFYKLMIQVPDALNAVGIKEKALELERYYPGPLRIYPRNLLDIAS